MLSIRLLSFRKSAVIDAIFIARILLEQNWILFVVNTEEKSSKIDLKRPHYLLEEGWRVLSSHCHGRKRSCSTSICDS
jgi:hypothetical protein